MAKATVQQADSLPPPSPSFAWAWATLGCTLAALTLAYPALTGGFLVNPRSDQYIAGFAFRDFAAQTLRTQGHFPLWNPYLFGGMPYVDAMHGDIFYPTFLLRMILPTDIAMTWGMILHFLLAGLAAYALFRAHKLSFYAALIGALAYMMSGQIAGLVSPGHDGKLFISALFPVMLLVLRMAMRDGRQWAWGVLALVVGLGVLTPHPQLLQYMLLAGGAYAVWMAYFEGGEGAPARDLATRRLFMALGAVVLGLAIGAIQFLPLKQYTPWSPRAGGHDWATATSYSMPPEETINWFLPQFSGILDKYWGRNVIHLHSEYLGLPVLLLAAAAFGTADAARQRLKWFLVGLFVVSAVWALGQYTPFYHLVYALVPGTKYFRAPSTIMFLSAFATAALAALGTERMLRGELDKRFLIGAGVAIAVLTLLGATGAFGSMFTNVVPEGRFDDFQANQQAVTAGAVRMCFFAVIALGLVYAAYARTLPVKAVAGLLAVLIAADLWSVEHLYWQFSPRASTLYATDPAIERIKHDSVTGRVMTVQLAAEMAPHDPFIHGDALMSNGVRLLTGYHGNELGRYQDVDEYDQGPQGLFDRLANAPAFPAITNLRWIYTNTGDLAKQAPDKFSLVLGPVKDAAGTDVWLYRTTSENPPAWIVPAIIKTGDKQSLDFLFASAFPTQSVGLFDTSSSAQGQQLTAVPPPLSIHARMTQWEPGHMIIELDAPAPDKSALMVSENYYPGWKATVDGQPAAVDRADYVIMGVPLKAGARKIELRFTDSAFERGKVVTFIALALALVMTIGGAALDRRVVRA